MNNVSIVGRLTKAPEVRTVADGKSVGRFTLAVNRNFKNQQGENDVDFILCTAWGKLAEHMVKYCGKGSQVGVIGRLQSRNYTNDEGKRIYITDVLALEVRFLQLKNPEPTVKVEDFQLPAAFTAQQPMQ
ncbi:MAG: single-stranded DNA-binding protein [Kurthia gibsonii]|uniref:Single-stranded DNA-binding protein n=1 Tax=Kurthia gibsonii TaxID=33946 RepID=A0ABU9LJP0_9BACL|nr:MULTISPECIES: single-stranded DNA-binding protein [Kurthia]MCA9724592.1 single-stranded DNA-binding protein [Kurthia sp.]AMA61947.1 single-stranded DNA-binding protein ssbB [Kurthia sp. 11kri321]MEB6112949.1 single-stranded DNA-binding protein [Kurthia gibsonii]RXH50889.1 single-stranded DNA-binding protein [Kurthia gibsonii]WIL39038.1 single-stranded DNA-binding protein [Kurthia sp. YJT4]